MITRKSKYEISLMKSAGGIVARVLDELEFFVKPGISTKELDEIAEKIITENNAVPTFKGYKGYPASICASVNDEVVHGIPRPDRVLQEGDIISIDVGVTYKGMVADSAITAGVGQISSDLERLIKGTKEALFDSISKMRAGNALEAASGAIEDKANEYGFGLVKQYGGHGVGRNLHEDPFVYNFRTGMPGPVLKSGMVMALEPMFNLGTGDVHTLSDGWTVVTNDKKASAHFEHTVLVTDGDPEVLTLSK